MDLDRLAARSEAVKNETNEVDVDRLLAIIGGSAGVRPKVMVVLNGKEGKDRRRRRHVTS